jgi:hypothetical protein
MAITLPIPQTIGTNYGIKNDGVIIGEISHEAFADENYFSFSHEVDYASKDQNNFPVASTHTWTTYETLLNEKTAVEPFAKADPSNDFPHLYLAVPDGVTGFTFDITTAGVGTFEIEAYYSAETGYELLPDVTYSADFFKTTGYSTILFDTPSDWAEEYIGDPAVPKQRWLRLQIVSGGTVSTQPTVTGAWQMTSDLTDAGSPTVNGPFKNPYLDLLPTDGDRVYLSSTNKPYGMIVTYQDPLTIGTVSYQYSLANGTYAELPVVSDTSEGLTYQNVHDVTVSTLTTSDADADAATVEALSGDGYITVVVKDLPTVDGDIVSFGLSDAQTGTIQYELQIYRDSGVNKYRFRDSVGIVTVTGRISMINDVLSVFRYKGRIYYSIDGTVITPTFGAIDDLLYGRFFATNTPTASIDIEAYMLDWSNRLAINLEFTLNNLIFSQVNATEAMNLPGHYYIQFLPPTDFASLSALLSPNGVVGYVIAIQSDFDVLPTENITLMDQEVLTINSEDNFFFPTGSQTIAQIVNWDIQNPDNVVAPQKFLLIINNGTSVECRLAEFEVPTNDTGILSDLMNTVGVVGVIIVQIEGTDQLTVGTPSFFYLSP